MTPVRLALGGLGALAVLYGGWLVLTRGHDLVDLGLWLGGGVVLHDAVLATVVLALGALVVRVLPRAAAAPAVVGLILLGSLTLVAVPVLGRFGARADNPTLLDRDYWAAWLVLAGLTLVAVLAVTLVRSRRR